MQRWEARPRNYEQGPLTSESAASSGWMAT